MDEEAYQRRLEELEEKKRRRNKKNYESKKKSLVRLSVMYRKNEEWNLKEALETIPLNPDLGNYSRSHDTTGAAIRYCIGSTTGFWSEIDFFEPNNSVFEWVDGAFPFKKEFTEYVIKLCDRMHEEKSFDICLDDFILVYVYEITAKFFKEELPDRYVEWRDSSLDLNNFPGLGDDADYGLGYKDGMREAMTAIERARKKGLGLNEVLKQLSELMED